MVGVGYIHVGVYVAFAIICGAIWLALHQRRAAAGWLVCATGIAGLESFLITAIAPEREVMIYMIATLPVAIICFCNAVAAFLQDRHHYTDLRAIMAVLTGFSVFQYFQGAPYLSQNSPLQLVCALGMAESAWRMFRARRESQLNIALAICIVGTGSVFALRAFAYPIIFPTDATYETVNGSVFADRLLALKLICIIGIVMLLVFRIVEANFAAYRTVAKTDGLTGLLNRSTFEHYIGIKCRSDDILILCDLDHFKQVNDLFGHLTGDDVLRRFAQLLINTGLPTCRFGGEEFALLVPGGDIDKAYHIAEQLRYELLQQSYPDIPPHHRISASFGIAAALKGEIFSDTFRRADQSLYCAKRKGRNRVEVATDSPVHSPLGQVA